MTAHLDIARAWHCPTCGLEHVSHDPRPHVPHHPCRALGGLSVPMAQVGVRSRHVLVERDDYVGAERGIVAVDGRPITAVHVERADGSNDCTILAPVATASGGAHNLH